MSELYLIAHKVRGKPACDVATQMECPICHDANSCGDYEGACCSECDGLGYWWIIPTSGHRAFPYWNIPIGDPQMLVIPSEYDHPNEMPLDLPDHYPERAAPSTPKLNLTALIPKSAPIRRRV